MKRIAEFYKVSFAQFEKDYIALTGDTKTLHGDLKTMYDNIKLPSRATDGSAGYDFYLPYEISLKCGQRQLVATGIRFSCKKDWAMLLMSKSGLGSKHRLQLDTCVSLIDSDYFYSENEGHILAPLIYDIRDDKQTLTLPVGKGFVQGVFIRFGITKSDYTAGRRNGGFGSTNA